MFKGLKDKVGKSITQANNKLRVNKNETPQNHGQKRASFQSSTMTASPSNSLIDLNSDSASINQTPNQQKVGSLSAANSHTTEQSPAILDLSNYESSEEIPVNSQHPKSKKPESHELGAAHNDNNPSASKANNTPSQSNTTKRPRNDSMSSQLSDVFHFSPHSAFTSPQHYLASDVESVASEVEDHNLLDSLGVGSATHDLGGKGELAPGGGSGAASGGGGRNVDSVSKDDLFKIFKKIYAKNQKYSGKYSQLVNAYRELEKDSSKLKEVLTKCQDKAIQRISELKEQLSLKQMALNDVEVNYTMMLQEKQEIIKVLQMQVSVLKDGLKVGKDGELVDVKEEKSDDVSTELNALKEKNSKLTKLLGNCKTTILDHREEIKKITLERDQLKKEQGDKEEVRRLKQNLNERVEELQEELQNYKEEKKKWVESEKGKDGLLEDDLRRLIEEKMDLEERLATLGDQNKRLNNKLKELESQLQQPSIDIAPAINTAAGVAANDSLIDLQTTSSSSTSLPSSSLLTEHKDSVAFTREQQQAGAENQLVKLRSENLEIKKNLNMFKNQAKIFKNICQCVFRAVVLDSNNACSLSRRASLNEALKTISHPSLKHPSSELPSPELPDSHHGTCLNNEVSDPGKKGLSKLEPEVQALYTRLYEDNKNFIDGRTDFLHVNNNNELRKSIVSVLKSGLDKSMSKLNSRSDNSASVACSRVQGVQSEAAVATPAEVAENNSSTTLSRNDEDDDDAWVDDDDDADDEDEPQNKVSGTYIDDYDNLTLYSNGGDDYMKRLLLKWKESCDKFEQAQKNNSLRRSQSSDLIQTEQCTPMTKKASRSKLVVLSDDQAGGECRPEGSNNCDTDDDKLIKSSLLDKYQGLRCEHEQLQENHEALKAEVERLSGVCTVESDEVKAQHQQNLSASSEERLQTMSDVNSDLSNKYSTLCEEMSGLQDGFNDVIKEKTELEKELLVRSDEMTQLQEHNNALAFESESLKNEVSRLSMDVKVKCDNYEHLKVEYEQICEEVTSEKAALQKLKGVVANMEKSSESLSGDLEGLRQENSSLKERSEGLKEKLLTREKQSSEKDEGCNKLKEALERLKLEHSALKKEKKDFEEQLIDVSGRLSEVEKIYEEVSKKEEDLRKKNNEYVSREDDLNRHLEESKNLNERLSGELEEFKKKDEVMSQLEEVSRERDTLREQVAVSREQYDQLQIRTEVLQDDLQKAMDGRDADDDEMSQLQAKHASLEQGYKQLEESLNKEVHLKQEEMEKLQEELEVLKKERGVCEEEGKASVEKTEALAKQLQESQKKNSEAVSSFESLKKQLEEKCSGYQQEIESLNKVHKERMELLEKQMDGMKNDHTDKLTEKDEKITSLMDELEPLKIQNSDLTKSSSEKMASLTEEKSELSENNESLKRQLQESSDKHLQHEKEHKKLVDDLNDMIAKLLQHKEEYEQTVEKHNKEMGGVKESEGRLKDEVEGLRQQLKEKEESSLRTEELLREVQASKEGVGERAGELQLVIEEQAQEIKRLNDTLLELQEDKLQCLQKTSSLEQEISLKNEQSLQSINETCKEWELKVTSQKGHYEQQLSSIKDELALRIKEKEELERNSNELLNTKNHEMNEVKQSLEDKVGELKDLKTSLDEQLQNLETLKTERTAVMQERDILKKQKEELEVDLEDKTLSLSESSQDTSTKLAALQCECESFKQEVEKLRKVEKDMSEEHLKRVQSDKEAFEVALKEKNNGWVEKMNEFKKKAETKIMQIKKQKDDFVGDASAKEELLKQELTQLKGDLLAKEGQLAEVACKYEALHETMGKESEALTKKAKELNETNERMQELQKTLSGLEEENIVKKEEIEKLGRSREEESGGVLKEECRVLSGKVVELERKIEALSAENSSLKAKDLEGESIGKELRKEVKSLSRELKVLKEEHKQLQEGKLELLEKAEKSKETELERLKQEYTDEMAELENAHSEKIKQLMKEVQATLSQKEKQYQENFTKTLEDAEKESEGRLRDFEEELLEARQDGRNKDDQLDDLGQRVLALNDKILEMHSKEEWEEMEERCVELEKSLEEITAEKQRLQKEREEEEKKWEKKKLDEHDNKPTMTLKQLSQASSNVSLESACSIIPVEFEYLRAILYKYLTENPDKETLAKVLCKIMKYSESEEQSVLSFHKR